MTYSLRTAILHGLLFALVAVSFILPVILGAGALLPVPVAAWTSVVVAGLALVDASFHAFSPTQRPTRGLRLNSALGALVLIAGWLVWNHLYSTIDATAATPYRIGTFLLGVGAVLSVFCIAIASIKR
ncbi:hypothetical protein I6J72_09345 [Corynebacterium sp. FDAARGOS 1242]|uniref:hypothetical protein n=1 Tax=Corynebacterium sp. FDAARGOS 1242 TaxID=2778078 RepID=UPI00194F1F13|nr:hypothetical protein [Corynebacterium sp. FDAARGOS 1242]QRP97375.1 hypothetical protein I6J72_09345 [Corynebacterium sp. FDAARGOS 1242]